VTSLSVVPSQLTSAAATLRTLAERAHREPALGYVVQPEQMGVDPLVSAISALHDKCWEAAQALVADMEETATGLRGTAASYVVTDNTFADSISSFGDR
jgi:hypothetical protein